jgi:hypothetical protein
MKMTTMLPALRLSLMPLLLLAMSGPCGRSLGPGPGQRPYRNPVLNADYSDPDAIRVGDTYYMTSSSFNSAPGLPLLQSKDMVNWQLVGHALPKQVPVAHFATPRHGERRVGALPAPPRRQVLDLSTPTRTTAST